ncbi:MAG TPA: NADP-dependent isocitrate dehydrogenase, partial [Clostridia bacterium]|nr:NADP-dependent isocitrate dehydrogenase [Clostridia bacterium]
WTGALYKRGELDGLEELKAFASKLEEAVLSTVGQGYMTGDLVSISELPEKTRLDLEEFLYKVKENLEEML